MGYITILRKKAYPNGTNKEEADFSIRPVNNTAPVTKKYFEKPSEEGREGTMATEFVSKDNTGTFSI